MQRYELSANGDSATLYVYDMIGEDYFSEDPLNAKSFSRDLQALGSVREINVRINSPGGSVFDGRAMASLLKATGARIVVDIDGLCASAATYLACAGHHVRMADGATYMIHEPSSMVIGNAADMRKEANLLDQIESGIVDTYQQFTGQTRERLLAMVKAETWMPARQALDLRFVHEITGQKIKPPAVNLSELPFKNVPEELKGQGRNPLKMVNEGGRLRIRFTQPTTKMDTIRNRLEVQRMKLENAKMRDGT